MRVLKIVDEDFNNYQKSSMFICTISCNGKCCIEANIPICVCHNDKWRNENPIKIPDDEIYERYKENNITNAIVFGGLEPFEQFDEMKNLIDTFRNKYGCDDDIVIYTGYNPDEIQNQVSKLKEYKNIIIKYGRYVPGYESKYNDILGVSLASPNQFAERIS